MLHHYLGKKMLQICVEKIYLMLASRNLSKQLGVASAFCSLTKLGEM